MSDMDGPSPPDRPEHERLAQRGQEIEKPIEELMAAFTYKMQMAFEAHHKNPQASTLANLSNELMFYRDELVRARLQYSKARYLAEKVGTTDAATRYQEYIVRAETGIRAVFGILDNLHRKALDERVIAPRDLLNVVDAIQKNIADSIALLDGICKNMLRAYGEGQAIDPRRKNAFIEHVATLMQMHDMAEAVIDLATERAPSDQMVEDFRKERVPELLRQAELIWAIRQRAIDAGIITNPDDA